MLKKRITLASVALAILSLTGCAAIDQHSADTRKVATFQVQIKEIGVDKKEHVLYSPTITALVGTTGEWRNIRAYSAEGGKVGPRNGYIVAIQPTVNEDHPERIGMAFIVDQFNPDARDGDRSWSTSTSDISGGEASIYWPAGGKQYAATARLLRIE